MNISPDKAIKVVKVLILKQNFNLLRAQKTILCYLLEKLTDEADHAAVEGIINLIDAIQDLAVDDFGMKRENVFNQSNDDDDEKLISLEACKDIVLNDREEAF